MAIWTVLHVGEWETDLCLASGTPRFSRVVHPAVPPASCRAAVARRVQKKTRRRERQGERESGRGQRALGGARRHEIARSSEQERPRAERYDDLVKYQGITVALLEPGKSATQWEWVRRGGSPFIQQGRLPGPDEEMAGAPCAEQGELRGCGTGAIWGVGKHGTAGIIAQVQEN